MVQNIRPPQDLSGAQRQPEGDAKSVRGTGSSVEAERGAPSPVLPPTREQVEQAVSRVKEVLRGTPSRLEIEIDPEAHEVVVKILNGESGEVIRQIPAQELLDLAKYLDGPKGLLVSERV